MCLDCLKRGGTAVTDCTLSKIEFPLFRGRRVEADFGGGDISSNGGAPLLAAADRRLGLLSGLARRLDDERQAGKVTHKLLPLLRQRVYAVALGHEDVNDHGGLRDDLALQTSVGRDTRLASSSTVGRLDRAADRGWAWAAHVSMVESFIASFEEAPKELVLDFDATDDAVHGHQVGRFFHGYYDGYCFLPLYVFCGHHLLVSYLRPSNKAAAKTVIATRRAPYQQVARRLPCAKTTKTEPQTATIHAGMPPPGQTAKPHQETRPKSAKSATLESFVTNPG